LSTISTSKTANCEKGNEEPTDNDQRELHASENAEKEDAEGGQRVGEVVVRMEAKKAKRGRFG